MKKKSFKLTRSETEIMELMWQQNQPLSRSEIIALSQDRSWKPGSIHILLNSMLSKDAIKVAGFVQSTKNYARTFVPTLTSDEYSVMQIKSRSGFQADSIPNLVTSLIEDVKDPEILDRLTAVIEEKRSQLSPALPSKDEIGNQP